MAPAFRPRQGESPKGTALGPPKEEGWRAGKRENLVFELQSGEEQPGHYLHKGGRGPGGRGPGWSSHRSWGDTGPQENCSLGGRCLLQGR